MIFVTLVLNIAGGKKMSLTKCTFCENASSCNWALFNKPIKGWRAEKTTIKGNPGTTFQSYHVIACPQFKKAYREKKNSNEGVTWTQRDINILLTNYGKISVKKIAKALGRNENSVRNKMSEIKKMR